MINGCNSPGNTFGCPKNPENVMVYETPSMYPTLVEYLDPTKKLTTSRAPELYWLPAF